MIGLKKEKNFGSTIILTILGIAILLIAVIGTTFAYFTAIVRGNITENNATYKSVSLGVINFEHGNVVNLVDVLPGRPKWTNEDEADNIVKFSLMSPYDMEREVTVGYSVYLNITENTFESDNLVFLTKPTPGTNSKEAKMKFGDENDTYKTIFTPKENELPIEEGSIEVGYIPPSTANQDTEQRILIGSGNIGGMASKDEWTFEIWVKETGEEQNYDQGKVLKAYITVEVTEIPTINK